MALRDQPYIPLYVQDFLTDEKLMECSASSTGIYIRIMCIMHKSDEYGTILLKQKDKQSVKPIKNFAYKLAKFLPYTLEEIENGITELISEDVLQINDDKLSQKRMIKDNAISIIRSDAGKKGGLKTQFAKAKPKASAKAKIQANTEDEIENENENVSDIVIEGEIEDYWEKWKNYKKDEFKFNYKSEVSEQAAKNELLNLSGNNAEIAIKIIDQSIANGWKGFFKLKNNEDHGKSINRKTGVTSEQIADAFAKNFATDYKEHGGKPQKD